MKRKFCSQDSALHDVLKGSLASSYELWFLMCLCWEMVRANTRILLEDYCGFFRHANKRVVCVWSLHFPEFYVHVLEDKTEDISGSLNIFLKILKEALLKWKLNKTYKCILGHIQFASSTLETNFYKFKLYQ